MTEGSPEFMIDFICHIQAPAVNVCFPDPVSSNIAKVLHHFRISGIKLWHFLYIGKRLIIWRISVLYRFRQIIKPVIIS